MRLAAAATRAHHPSGAVRILYFGSRSWLDVPDGLTLIQAKMRLRCGIVMRGPRFHAIREQMTADITRFGRIICVNGKADGADELSDFIAAELGQDRDPYPVRAEEWSRIGPAAGHRRNARMDREGAPVEGREFASGLRGSPISSGTAGMAAILRRRGVPVIVHREDGIELPVHAARRVGR